MSLSITIDLTDSDLAHFTDVIKRAQDKAQKLSAEAIIAAATKVLESGRNVALPAFIASRLVKLEHIIALAKDSGFGLEAEDRERVLACLAYFAEPEDVIPDSVPVLGFLDDAIMVELLQRELRHELDAYEDFVDYRNDEARRLGVDPSTLSTQRVDWAEARRTELIERMRRRRRGQGYGSTSSYVTTDSWKPLLFTVR